MVVSVLLNSGVCFSDCLHVHLSVLFFCLCGKCLCLSVCLHVHLSVLSFCLFGKCLCLYSGCHGRASRCWIFTSSTGSSFRCSNVLPTRPSTHLKHTNISFLCNQCDFTFETHKYQILYATSVTWHLKHTPCIKLQLGALFSVPMLCLFQTLLKTQERCLNMTTNSVQWCI